MSATPRMISHFLLLPAILGLVFSSNGWSQATWGAISGFVTDSSGAIIPGVKISVENEKTGVKTGGVTDAAGLYNVTHLDPGVYSVSAQASGFKHFLQPHIVLRVDSTVRVDPKLEVGEVIEQVTVSGSSVAELKTEKTDVDRVISQHELDNIPLPNHNITLLYLTTPGVDKASLQIGNNENPSEG